MARVRVLVVGDLMIDHYIWGSCDRISPEAPVPVIVSSKETRRLGGAGNVINNLISLDAKVGAIGVVGDDIGGEWIKNELRQKDIDAKIIVQKERKTSQKSRIMAVNQQVLRLDGESVSDIECEQELIDIFKNMVDNYDIVLLSDYLKGVLTSKVCSAVIEICNNLNRFVLVDPKGRDYTKYRGATLITPNKKEASDATGIVIKNDTSLKEAAKKLKQISNLKYSLITVSEDGIALLDEDDKMTIFPALAKEVYDVTGAGDSVLASLGYCLANKEDIKDAIKTANLAAAVVVGKVGSASATWKEIESLRHGKDGFLSKIKTLDDLKKICSQRGKKRIVFTNGCFDILHLGHVKYLQEASSFGDVLIVAVNSDSSVRSLKGSSRPINSQNDRAAVIAALEFVDYVIIFNESTPKELISLLMPNILVKGGDYKNKEVVGSEIVDDVRLVKFEENKSTTGIIEKIKNS